MALISLGNLEKIKLIAFLDNSYKVPVSTYIAMFNPEEFKEKFAINFDSQSTPGGVQKLKFNHIESGEVTVKFLVDGTGASKVGGGGPPALIVQKNISLFKSTVSGGLGMALANVLSKSVHQTPCLILQWGKFIYKCRCTSFDIVYKLFNSVGLPIKAEIDVTFQRDDDVPKTLSFLTTFLSPDLTKTIIVKEGDTLPSLAEKEYGDPGLYLEVARANNLTNFRNIKPGTLLAFPPIDKTQQ
jgi:nucleoid-associated protein YgaU